MAGRTWKDVESSAVGQIRNYLLDGGGIEDQTKSQYELWRVKISGAAITAYTKGTIYSTPSNFSSLALHEIWEHIDLIAGSPFAAPESDFVIGLDEAGKGEVFGNIVLAAVIIPKAIYKEIELMLGPADTKKKHTFDFWEDVLEKLNRYKGKGFSFAIEKISPAQIAANNINRVMDATYRELLSGFLQKVAIDRCRIVLDDYGTGPQLKQFLNSLKEQGAEVVVTTKADDTYLETKAASLVAKRFQQLTLKQIREDPQFVVDGATIGSGNAGDSKTINWLNEWYQTGNQWPWFVKTSFKTVRKIENKPAVIKEDTPLFNEKPQV